MRAVPGEGEFHITPTPTLPLLRGGGGFLLALSPGGCGMRRLGERREPSHACPPAGGAGPVGWVRGRKKRESPN